MKQFIAAKFFLSPLDAMFSLLAFIFVKELEVTALQLSLLVASKPIVGLLSFYGTLFIKSAPQRIKPFIIALSILGCVPCLLFPFVDTAWFFLISYALFIMALRAAVPAWTELLRINLTAKSQTKAFSIGAIVNYLITIIFPLLLSGWLDYSPHVWKWLFFWLACMQGVNVIFLCTIQLKRQDAISKDPEYCFTSLKSILLAPWKKFAYLMQSRPDFRRYQILFVLGGIGLVAMQPALPIFFKETLRLSYTELTLATHFCKGVAFAISSPFWAWLKLPCNN